MTIEMFRELDLVEITTDKLTEDGLNLGDKVVVAAVKAFPVSEEDPYTQRVKLFVQKINENNNGVVGNIFVIDPTSVRHTGLKAIQGEE